jgi:hypothetical protein
MAAEPETDCGQMLTLTTRFSSSILLRHKRGKDAGFYDEVTGEVGTFFPDGVSPFGSGPIEIGGLPIGPAESRVARR